MKFLDNFWVKKIASSLPYLFVFISALYRPWDADLGWHLTYGEHFFKYGEILKTNIFSTEMAGYYWPNTGWLNDLITYQIFNLGGFLGLTITASVVITLTFWFLARAYDLDFYHKAIIFPLLVILEAPLNEISYRGQQFSILLLAVLMYLLLKVGGKKQLVLIPLLFTFWINTHGQFILGLAVLFIYIALKILEPVLVQPKTFHLADFKKLVLNNKFNFSLLGISLLATLINPFGIEIYKTAFTHFQNKDLQYILEYLPFDNLSEPWWNQMAFGIFMFLGLLFTFFSGGLKKQIPDLGVVSVLYGLSWLVRRYAWSMYYLGVPFLKPLADFVKPDTEKIARMTALLLFTMYTAFAIYLKLPLGQYLNMNWQTYCLEYNNCSGAAIEYIRDNNLQNNLLTLYGWGGYMIWNYPEVKPSIDGRMHLWKDSSGYSAFSQYYALEQNWKDVDKSKYDVVLMWHDKPIYNRLEELVKQGKWKKPYEDEFAGVFVRVKNATPASEFIFSP